MIFFTADTHFGHSNIIRYCNRPYSNIHDMDEDLIKKWNSVVKKNDTTYVVGDFAWNNPLKYVDRLNGKITLIAGGHDYRWKSKFNCFDSVFDSLTICPRNQTIVLSHFCYRVWNKSHYGSWHLFGHSHGKLEPIGKSWDVGVDTNNFFPLSLDDIEEIMKNRPDNFNLMERKNG